MSNINQKVTASVAKIENDSFESPWDEKTIEETLMLDYNHIIIVCDKTDVDKIVGYVIYNVIADESELLRIAVDKAYRGRGYGEYLIKKYFENVKDIAIRSLLEVRQTNKSAIALYEKNKYKSIAIRKNYYNKPVCDAVIYERKLP